MNYENFEKGEVVRLDAAFNNSSIVEVISQSPNRVFSRIKDENSDWEVMTDRLSRIENEFASKLIESQKDIDPEIAQIVSDHFWELL